MTVSEALQTLYSDFQKYVSKQDESGFQASLNSLKIELTKLPSLPPRLEEGPGAQEERLLARDVYETAVLFTSSLGDDAGFDRNFALLKPYYLDIRDSIPASGKEPLLWGLRLLMLLVQNRIAEFHSTLELLPLDIVSATEVSYVMELEGWMMQGSYANIGSAKSSAVSPYYIPLLDRIVTTVRNEVASCSQAAYKKLRIEDAQKILDIRADEVDAYCAEYGWKKENGYIMLQESMQQDALQGLPEAERVIQNCMQYAKELERII